MRNLVFFITIGVVFNIGSCAKYPSDLPRCKNADETCLAKVITDVISGNFGGHRGLHLVAIDPLKIKSMVVAQESASPVNIQLKFMDVTLSGFKDTKIYKVKGFEKDLKTTKFEVLAKIPLLQLVGPYEIKGQVLILPISGKGRSNMTLENVDAKMKLIGTSEIRNGKEYFNLTKVKLDFNLSRLYMNFENLFNGDKALGDNMNVFLNENWQEIFGELKTSIQDTIAEILQITVHGPFAVIPYKELFLA